MHNSNIISSSNAFESILQASPVVQFILLLLVSLSVFCWAIAYAKNKQLQLLTATNFIFLERFMKAQSLEDLYENLDETCNGSLARVFKSAFLEMRRLSSFSSHYNRGTETHTQPQQPLLISGIDNIERVLNKTVGIEVGEMESRLTVLATTGSTGPFIGLFGTVWGIMGAFQKIGITGNASLAVVAPGISEALIATAIGLAAAIPAVVLYNHFLSKIKHQEIELTNFSSDFLNIVRRNIFVNSSQSDNDSHNQSEIK